VSISDRASAIQAAVRMPAMKSMKAISSRKNPTKKAAKAPSSGSQRTGASSRQSLKRPASAAASSRRTLKRPAGASARLSLQQSRLIAKMELIEKMEDVNWVPLESNPEMLNEFAHAVGLQEKCGFVDVLGVDPELLQMVPKPCLAVTLLYECNRNLERYKKQQNTQIKSSGQVLSDKVFFMNQFVGNACGTIAAIHCLANSADRLGVSKDSSLGRFIAENQGESPEVIGAALADFEEFHEASEESAEGGQTEAPEADEELNHHFISFVEQDGDVYELDGTKAFPINHGPVGDGLLNAATQVVKTKFMAQDVENIQFNMMALVVNEPL